MDFVPPDRLNREGAYARACSHRTHARTYARDSRNCFTEEGVPGNKNVRCRSSGSLFRWWESNQKPSRNTRAVFIRTSASLLVCNPQQKTPAHNLSWLVLRRVMNTGHCTSKRINIDRRMGRIKDMHIRMSSSTITHMNNDGLLARHTEHSATVTRTRVARVGAEYPNQLHYSAAGLRSNNMLAICVSTLETQSRDTFENKLSSLCVCVRVRCVRFGVPVCLVVCLCNCRRVGPFIIGL